MRTKATYFAAILFVAAVLAGCEQHLDSSAARAATGATNALTDIGDIKDLEARFTEHQGEPRLIVLLSPT